MDQGSKVLVFFFRCKKAMTDRSILNMYSQKTHVGFGILFKAGSAEVKRVDCRCLSSVGILLSVVSVLRFVFL